jgi:hypothetical protein
MREAPAAGSSAPEEVLDRSAPAAAPAPPSEAPSEAAPEARQAPPRAQAAPSPRAMRSERDVTGREDSQAQGAAAGAVQPARKPAVEARRAPGALHSQQKETASQVSAARVAAILKELDAEPPEKWLERIQALRREGQTLEARDLLAEFKRRYPSHPLPPELQ